MNPELSEVMSALTAWKEVAERLAPEFQSAPTELHFELTYSCNQTCRMCDMIPLLKGHKGQKVMTAADIENFIAEDEVLKGIETVILSGGEPFLRKDLPEIAEAVRRRFPRASLGILSNLYDRKMTLAGLAEIERRIGLDGLWIGSSLDGASPATHDTVRNEKNAFVNLMETLPEVRKHFVKSVSLTFTVTPLNYHEILACHELAASLGCWFGVQMIVQKDDMEVLGFSEEMYDEAERQIEEIIKQDFRDNDVYGFLGGPTPENYHALWARIYYLAMMVPYHRQKSRIVKHCPAGRRFAMVDPYGNLSFCPVLKSKEIGNVRDEAIGAIWPGKTADGLRRDIDDHKCDCWLICMSLVAMDQLFRTTPAGVRFPDRPRDSLSRRIPAFMRRVARHINRVSRHAVGSS